MRLMKPDGPTRKKRAFSLSSLSIRAFPPVQFFFWTDSRPLTLMPPSFPSTQSRLVECGLDARTAERGGAGVRCDPGAVPERVKVGSFENRLHTPRVLFSGSDG